MRILHAKNSMSRCAVLLPSTLSRIDDKLQVQLYELTDEKFHRLLQKYKIVQNEKFSIKLG